MTKYYRKRSRKNNRKVKRNILKMIGGAFSDEDKSSLLKLGFKTEDFDLLEHNVPNMNLIEMSLEQINPQTGSLFTAEELIRGLQDNINEDAEENKSDVNSSISNDIIATNIFHDLDNINYKEEKSVGGKKKQTKNRRRNSSKKGRTNRKKYIGGCYGNGIGANNYDPNFSIYNTRELQLFPYKPMN
jgi:hypothetical protein